MGQTSYGRVKAEMDIGTSMPSGRMIKEGTLGEIVSFDDNSLTVKFKGHGPLHSFDRGSYMLRYAPRLASHGTLDAVEIITIFGISDKAWERLPSLYKHLRLSRTTASKRGFYDRLVEYNKPISDHIHGALTDAGFANGEPAKNTPEANPDAAFWWALYNTWCNIVYSPNHMSIHPNHHSTAFDRNEALIAEIEYLIDSMELIGKTKKFIRKMIDTDFYENGVHDPRDQKNRLVALIQAYLKIEINQAHKFLKDHFPEIDAKIGGEW